MVTDYRGLEMCQSWVQNDRTTILLFCYSGCQCFFLINLFFLKTLIVCPMEKRTGRLAWVEAIILSNAQATAAFWAMLIKLALATTVIRTKYFPRAECQFACLFSLGTKTSFNRSSAELSLALFSEWQTLWGWAEAVIKADEVISSVPPNCCQPRMKGIQGDLLAVVITWLNFFCTVISCLRGREGGRSTAAVCHQGGMLPVANVNGLNLILQPVQPLASSPQDIVPVLFLVTLQYIILSDAMLIFQ